jgi:hypothetical protein
MIYVEVLVRAPLEALWAHTQTPDLHERWDLRFSTIEYLPKPTGSGRQRFRYTTRIGFGAEIVGYGETVGQRTLIDGSRTSALTFASNEPRSLIREGTGYWKYIPTPQGIRFLTAYDYRTRFGSVGAFFDRLVFRPLMGWATAWSFDRLRLWLEEQVDPREAMRHAVIHAIARIALAGILALQGIAPAIVGAPPLLFWHRRWPIALCLASLPVVAAASGISLQAAVAAVSLGAVDLLVLRTVPSAANCLRRPSREQP